MRTGRSKRDSLFTTYALGAATGPPPAARQAVHIHRTSNPDPSPNSNLNLHPHPHPNPNPNPNQVHIYRTGLDYLLKALTDTWLLPLPTATDPFFLRWWA